MINKDAKPPKPPKPPKAPPTKWDNIFLAMQVWGVFFAFFWASYAYLQQRGMMDILYHAAMGGLGGAFAGFVLGVRFAGERADITRETSNYMIGMFIGAFMVGAVGLALDQILATMGIYYDRLRLVFAALGMLVGALLATRIRARAARRKAGGPPKG